MRRAIFRHGIDGPVIPARQRRLALYCEPLTPTPQGPTGVAPFTFCAFVPPTPGYAPCSRLKGHSGPCAHYLQLPEYNDLFFRAENGKPGRTRSMRETMAIRHRYKMGDRWNSLSGAERLDLLRQIRRELAKERHVPQAWIPAEDLAKVAGVRYSHIRGLILTLAGDFSPTTGRRKP